jgi:hypothetical protein
MKNIILIFPLLLLFSCKDPQVGEIIIRPTARIKKLNIEPQLKPYLDSFEALHGNRVDDLEMSVKTLDPQKFPDVLGYCELETVIVEKLTKREEYKTPKIVLNALFWNSPLFHNQFKEELVFHELGHCILKRKHETRVDSNGIPISIMYPYHLGLTVYSYYGSTDFYSINYEKYMSELFSTNRFAGLSFDDSIYSSSVENEMASRIYLDENEEKLNFHVKHTNCVKDKGVKIINENSLE